MKRALLPLVIFLVLAGFFYLVLDRMERGEYNPREVPTEFIGRQAPGFSLPGLYDTNVLVSPVEMAGQMWLLNVWATWCNECLREHAYLMYLAHDLQIPILGVNWRDDTNAAKSMLEKLGNPFVRIASDPRSEVVIDWGVYGAPETFLIDAQGIIRAKHAGPLSQSVWDEKFASYFQQEAGG